MKTEIKRKWIEDLQDKPSNTTEKLQEKRK